LRAWLPDVFRTAFNVARVHMTFNNNHANYATTNAAEMADIVSGAAREVIPSVARDLGRGGDHQSPDPSSLRSSG
jgi:hypothetical protein